MRKLGIEGDGFQFTNNWFLNRNLVTFRERVLPCWQDKPCVYLEIGVYEGQSMVWMLQRVLTHPDSRAVGIDPWLMTTKLSNEDMANARVRAIGNLLRACPNTSAHNSISGVLEFGQGRCSLIRGNSAEVLRRMIKQRRGYASIKQESVDLCMIDGDHNELAVLDDARNCWKLLKPGGWLLFDDVENDRKKQAHVKQGLKAFVEETTGIEFLWKQEYVEAYRKKSV